MKDKEVFSLQEQFPKLFDGVNIPKEHNKGWDDLVYNLCDSINRYIEDNNKYKDRDDKIPPVTITQMKEKYGGLRFYHDGGDELIDGMVWFAEKVSYSICEHCGTNQNVFQPPGYWRETICKSCFNKRVKYQKRRKLTQPFRNFYYRIFKKLL